MSPSPKSEIGNFVIRHIYVRSNNSVVAMRPWPRRYSAVCFCDVVDVVVFVRFIASVGRRRGTWLKVSPRSAPRRTVNSWILLPSAGRIIVWWSSASFLLNHVTPSSFPKRQSHVLQSRSSSITYRAGLRLKKNSFAQFFVQLRLFPIELYFRSIFRYIHTRLLLVFGHRGFVFFFFSHVRVVSLVPYGIRPVWQTLN